MHRFAATVKIARTGRAPSLFAVSALVCALGAACAPPPEDEAAAGEDPGIDPAGVDDGSGVGIDDGSGVDTTTPPDVPDGPFVQAPGGAYLDIQCGGKHRRFPIASVTHQGARYERSGGTETFEHLDTRCNRVEIDTNDHYQGGRHVFEGEVRIGRVSGQSIVQIFNGRASGPIMMIKAYSSGGGTLRKLSGSATLATGVEGKWVRVRIVHDLGSNTMTIDINGSRKWSGSGGRGGSFNLKYGNYGTGAPTDVQWRGVSL